MVSITLGHFEPSCCEPLSGFFFIYILYPFWLFFCKKNTDRTSKSNNQQFFLPFNIMVPRSCEPLSGFFFIYILYPFWLFFCKKNTDRTSKSNNQQFFLPFNIMVPRTGIEPVRVSLPEGF